jgi:two-component system, NtrC family, response regulator HydG
VKPPGRGAYVLIVDDDRALGETLAEELASDGFVTRHAASGREAAQLIDEDFDAIVTDLRMPEIDGLDVLARSRKVAPDRPVIVMTAFSAVDTAIESIRQGAYHYLTKPFQVDELALFLHRALDDATIRREAKAMRQVLRESTSFTGIIGAEGALREACNLVARVADASTPVLLLGETGTGKGLLARALHEQSHRAARSFVTVNCAALPENLLESELFGHVRGAFTGATTHRGGLMVEANGGTLFLDEIGEMPLPLQAKLLHVLERGVVRAVGSDKEKAVDVRFVTATHRSLRNQVAAGQFREDLLFRLNVVTVEIPPLRRRREDFPLLVERAIESARAKHRASPVQRLSAAAFERLLTYSWPGNVRELSNVIERAVLLGASPVVTAEELAPALASPAEPVSEFALPVVTLQEVNRRYARWAVDQLQGRRVATADALEIDRKTLAKLLGDTAKSV